MGDACAGGLRGLYKLHAETIIQNPPHSVEHSKRAYSWPDFNNGQRRRLRRVTCTVSEMGPIDGRMFQDYLRIPNFDGGMDSMRTPSGYSMASTVTGFDDMVDQLELANRLRQGLQTTVTPSRLKDLGGFLAILLDLERRQAVDATTIEQLRYTRLDKLVEETIHWKVDDRTAFDTQECALIFRTFVHPVARQLQLEWQVKFGEDFFTIDKSRQDNLAVDGALQGVSLNQGYRQNFEDRWNPMPPNFAAKQIGDLGFEPGDWWLNVQCATRDGIIESPVDAMTASINRDFVYALVLDTGKETIGKEPGIHLYTKRGRHDETLLPVMQQRDRPFRVLRKYGLDSDWAPPAGVRYDGLYLLKSFSWGYAASNKKEYEVQLGLKRVEHQKPMTIVVNTSPKPSQLDDWVLYNEVLTDDYRSRTENPRIYAARKMLEQEELMESARMDTRRAVHKLNMVNRV